MKHTFVVCFLFITISLFAFQEKEEIKQVKIADSLLQEKAFALSKDLWKSILNQNTPSAPQYTLYASKKNFCEAKLLDAEGNFDEAVIFYKKALNSLKKGTSAFETSYIIDIYNGLYHALAYSGNWKAALKKGVEGKAFIDTSVKKKQQADYIYDLGYIHDRLGNYSEAIDFYKQSIALYESQENLEHFDLGLAYNNLGTTYRQIGFFSERLRCLEKARFYWEKDPNISENYLLTVYGNLMNLYIEYGNVTKAKALYKNISKLSSSLKEQKSKANLYQLEILYLTFLSETKLAKQKTYSFQDFFKNLSKTAQRENSPFYLRALTTLAFHFVKIEHYSKATELLDTVLHLGKKHDQHYFRMLAYTEKGKIKTAQKEHAKAIDLLDAALAIGNLTDIRRVNEINLLIQKATLQALDQPVDTAHKTLKKALTFLAEKDIDNPQQITKATFEKQHSSFFVSAVKDAAAFYKTLYYQTNNKNDAQNAHYLYQLGAEVFALYYQNGEYNTHLNQLNKTINEGLFEMHTALEIPLSESLFTRILSNNSQVLRNAFEQKHLQYLNVEEDLLSKRNLLHLALNNLDTKDEDYANKKQQLSASMQKLDDSITAKEPMYESFYASELQFEKIQKHLSADEALISYFTGNKNTYAVTVTNTNIKLNKLAATEILQKKVASFYQLLQNPAKNTISASQEIHSLLLGNVSDVLNKKSAITFIPDDFLHYLPFEVLSNNNQPLIETHEIQYSSSLPLWYLIKNTEINTNNNKKFFAAFAPKYKGGSMGTTLRNNRYKDLAGAKREAKQIVTTLNGDLFLDEEATISNFTQQATAYKIYHLAMHATLDDKEHSNSGLLFYNNQTFNFSSLYDLYFPAELVVLSACNTGIGILAAGEGLLSLSRALTYAGVRSNVYSLWEVPDEETSEIMVSFYKQLNAGKNKAVALAAAKREFIEKNPLKEHPYYWAGFVVSGDTKPIKSAPKTMVWLIGTTLFFTLLILGYIYWKKQKTLI